MISRIFGRGADALAQYVAGIARLPQLTPLGKLFLRLSGRPHRREP
jgi:hypothetical protein